MTDYLTQLPAELFITICELVRDSDKRPYLGRISKAFLPVARRFTFRKVTVLTYAQLAELCDVLIASPGAALHVDELRIILHNTFHNTHLVTPAMFASAMGRLECLSKLTLNGSSRLVKSILAPASATLPRLHSLSVVDRFDDWSNPFSPSNFRHLEQYTSLSRVELTVNRRVESLGHYRQAVSLPKLDFGWYLWLVGPLSGDDAVRDLLSCFDRITNLGLHDDTPSNEATLPALLGMLKSPASVQVLSLKQATDDARPLIEGIPKLLNLKTIDFHRGTWSSAMLPVLHDLERLQHLYFPSQGLALDELRNILDGPLKIKNLKTVYLDGVARDNGSAMDEGWTPEFSLDGLVDLLPVAERVGVRLEGYAANRARAEVEKREQRARKAAAAAGAAANRGGGS